MSELEATNTEVSIIDKYKIRLCPEGATKTIQGPKDNLGEIVARRTASSKSYLMPDNKVITYCWNPKIPVHYQDDYAAKDGAWEDIDPAYYEEAVDHYLFPKMPHSVKVFKSKYGYEITDRISGKVMAAELLEIDDVEVAKYEKMAEVLFDVEILPNAVRFWKETTNNGPKKFKWFVKDPSVESSLKFREEPEAFDASKELVAVSCTKEIIKDGYYWTEEVDKTGVRIDTDFAGGTGDGYISGSRSTSDLCNTSENKITVGRDPFWSAAWRGFVEFDTSTLDGEPSQANLKLVVVTDGSVTDFDVQIVEQDWSSPLCTNREANFDGCLSPTSSVLWRNTSGMSTNTQYTSSNLTTSYVSLDGTTRYSFRSKRDKDDAGAVSNDEYVNIASANHATAGYRPVLVVEEATGYANKVIGVTPAKVMGVEPAKVIGI